MINRTIKSKLLESINSYPVTLVTGARQVGKSTLCYELVKEKGFEYVSLDKIEERSLANDDPRFFLTKHKAPLIIDEIQYAPVLFEYIENIVNEERLNKGSANGMYILTGSQQFHLMNDVTQSLAGRVGIINMSPLSINEIIGRDDIPFSIDIDVISRRLESSLQLEKLYFYITRGLYPELYNNPSLDSEFFYSKYVSDYIDKDLPNIINVKNKLIFYKFMKYLASITGQELVYDNISKLIGVDRNTIVQWTSILEASNIIYLLEPYVETSLTKRVIKRPKIYFKDTGLACYLTHLSDPETLMSSYFSGAFVETFVVNEIMKSYQNTNTHAGFYYYRDSRQNEIDLIILRDGKLTLLEVKSGMNFNASDVKGFDQISDSRYKVIDSAIVCMTDSIYKVKDSVYVVPIKAI